MRFLLLTSFFIAGACSSKSQESEFRPTHVITCRHWTNQCYHSASQRCKGAYDLISKSETKRTGGPRDLFREYTMVVKCK